jgi:MFS family permease
VVLYATQPLLPLLATVFHASHFAVTLTITAPTAAVALAAPVAGRLGDRLGQRRVIVGSALALTTATALAATARTLPELVLWRFLQGLFTPGIFAVTIAYIHAHWPAGRSGAATSAYISGTIVGGFSGRILAGVLTTYAGWQVAFLVLATVAGAMTTAAWLWLPDERRIGGGPISARVAPSSMSPLVHLRNPGLVATYGVGFCVLFTLVAMFTYVTFLLAAPPFYLSTAALGSLFVVYLAGAGMTALSGRWMDRMGYRRMLAASVGIGITGALLTLGHSLPAVVAGLAVCCSGVFIAQAVATSYLGVAAKHDQGVAIGLYATCYYLGGSAGGAVPAPFWNAGGWPACVALAVGVQILLLALGTLWWRPASGPATMSAVQ